MVFVACGLNHKTAPLDLREKVAVTATLQDSLLHKLLSHPQIHEAAILSTCNRMEIYCETEEAPLLPNFLANEFHLPLDFLSQSLYTHQGEQGIRHLLRVAIGLDSMMIGEAQILGQMKQAYQKACELGSVKTRLRPIFEYIFSASKKIRTESGIGTKPVSIAYTSVQLIGKLFKDYKKLSVLMIGSGETASLVAKYLQQAGVEQFLIASRSQENAQKLALPLGGKTLAITDLHKFLPEADVVICATSCPLPFINKGLVAYALQQRNQEPMFLLDLSVPRNIDSDVEELANTYLYNIDHLQDMIDKGMEERYKKAKLAEQLIEISVANYSRWHRSRKVKSIICDYRSQMEDLAHRETKRALKQLSSGQSQQTVLIEFSQRLINKLTHSPTIGLKQLASDNQEDLLSLAQYLFKTKKQLAAYEEIT